MVSVFVIHCLFVLTRVDVAIKELVADANFECNEEGIVRAPYLHPLMFVLMRMPAFIRRSKPWTTRMLHWCP